MGRLRCSLNTSKQGAFPPAEAFLGRNRVDAVGRWEKKKGLPEPLLSYAALRLVRIFVFEFRIACRVFSGLNPK